MKSKSVMKREAIQKGETMSQDTSLVDLQGKYIKLLTGEIMEMAGYASADGWVSTKVEEGKKLRAEIDNARDKAC